jgi:hypothetical protein
MEEYRDDFAGPGPSSKQRDTTFDRLSIDLESEDYDELVPMPGHSHLRNRPLQIHDMSTIRPTSFDTCMNPTRNERLLYRYARGLGVQTKARRSDSIRPS